MKIEEVLKAITDKQHRLDVLEDVIGYLEEFLPSDVELDPEKLKIEEEGVCLNPTVSNKAIESVIDNISELIKTEREELNKLNSLETKPNGRSRTARKKPPSKPKPKRGKK